MKPSIGWASTIVCAALLACSPASDARDLDDGGPDGLLFDSGVSSGSSGSGGSGGSTPVVDSCEQEKVDSTDGLPDRIECLGLYSDVQQKKLASGVRAFAPAVPLWSDGSEKERWVYLPPGEKIDTRDINKWVFPIGTKFFKQFSAGGRRMETRIYQKMATNRWSHATYVWNNGETAAMRATNGADISVSSGGSWVGGSRYHVPTQRDCDQCHEGQVERVLGFEAISLGLSGASGITLATLAGEGLLTTPPAQTQLTIGDDGTGMGAPVLGWLHINCGVSCHNDRPASEAYQTGLRMRLDAKLLDGRSSRMFETETTTIGMPAKGNAVVGETRIIRGNPRQSLLFKLITSRKGETDQMPPLATVAVDSAHNAQVEAWISRMGPSF